MFYEFGEILSSKPWSLRGSLAYTHRYRAMHYSAKGGLAITCRLSVRPSVRLSLTLLDHDHIGWKSWKLIAYWSTKAAISLKRVKIKEKLLWRACRKSLMLFRFFGSPPYFYFQFRIFGQRDGRFCLNFAHTAHQPVLDGTIDFLAANHVRIVGLCIARTSLR